MKQTLATIATAALAVWIGVNVAQEQHLLAAAVSGLALWGLLSWTTQPSTEAWLLAFLFFGYTIGNRGFAQIMPLSGVPLFLGELGLAVGLSVMLLRGALVRRFPLHWDPLNGWLATWILLGSFRVALDVRVHGFMALRDFALVYYAFYFYLAQAAADQGATRSLLHRAMLATFFVLPVTAALVDAFPEFMLTRFTLNHVPVIFYKDDLVGTYLCAGFLLLLPTAGVAGPERTWRWIFAVGSLLVGLIQLSRASMLGLMVGAAVLAAAGRWRAGRTVVTVVAVGTLLLSVYALFERRDVSQTKAYGVYEQLISIVDVQGTGSYRNKETMDSGDNNRFRLVWWRTVAEETLQGGPLFGLGFGYDLARAFLQEYSPLAEDFTARSPHSVIFTTFGRMGLVGLAGLLAAGGAGVLLTRLVVRRVRAGEAPETLLSLFAACWVVAVSSCFGVVLEGPMGAIPFWIMLGLAAREARDPPAA